MWGQRAFPLSINVCPTCGGWGRLPSVPGQDPPFDRTESLIVQELESILPSAAASYRQAIRDLKDDSRESLRGPALELRESLREVLDHLAPDRDVEGAEGFKHEAGQLKPTMRQKTRFIRRKRRRPEGAAKTADDTVSLVDDLVAQVVRGVYQQGSLATHVASPRSQVKRLKMYVDTALAELLDLHRNT